MIVESPADAAPVAGLVVRPIQDAFGEVDNVDGVARQGDEPPEAGEDFVFTSRGKKAPEPQWTHRRGRRIGEILQADRGCDFDFLRKHPLGDGRAS